jgi:chromosome segregation ATPase
MNQRITTTLILIGIIATAGCSTTQPVSGSAVSPQAARHSASTTLDQYRRIHAAFKELQRQAGALQERLATAGDETEELYARLAKEQKLRREAILQLESAKAEIDAATHRQRTIDTLRAALDSTRAQLAATGIELKARREELMKIVLGQQEWNEFILEKLKLQQ